MGWIFLAIGLVCIVEGLVYALAPHIVEDLLEMLRSLPIETRRLLGLVAIVSGVFMLWLANIFGVM